MEILLIENLAYTMRQTIESTPKNKLPISISKFPYGACGDTSILLEIYLYNNNLFGFDYVYGEKGKIIDSSWTSHAWLCRDRLIVDITVDQFTDAPSPIIVSESSGWHNQFKITNRGPTDFRNSYGFEELFNFYEYLKPQLFKNL